MNKKIFYALVFILFIVVNGRALMGQNNQNAPGKTQKMVVIPGKSFKHTDIGNPAIAGTVLVADGNIDMTAGGEDIWGVKDEFNYVYIERAGDFDFVTRVESLSAADLYTKAGIMAREDLSAGSRHIFFQVFPDNKPRNKNNGGCEFQYRAQKNGEMKAIYPKSTAAAPEFPAAYPNTWIRLQRIKNEFTGFYSTDGVSWKVYTKFTQEFPAKVYLGLAVTSHNGKSAASAVFRNTGEISH